MDAILAIGVGAIILSLMWLYGEIRYSDGYDSGRNLGVLSGAYIIMNLFEKRKLVQIDSIGNIYRINDEGNRGDTVVSREELLDMKKIDIA